MFSLLERWTNDSIPLNVINDLVFLFKKNHKKRQMQINAVLDTQT